MPQRIAAAGKYCLLKSVLHDLYPAQGVGVRIRDPSAAALIAVEPFSRVERGQEYRIDLSDAVFVCEGNIDGLPVRNVNEFNPVFSVLVKNSTEDDPISLREDASSCCMCRLDVKKRSQRGSPPF